MDHQHAFLTEFTANSMKSVNILNDSSAEDEDELFACQDPHTERREDDGEPTSCIRSRIFFKAR